MSRGAAQPGFTTPSGKGASSGVGEQHGRTRRVVGLGLVSGLIALVCTVVLIGDHVLALRRATAEQDLITELEKQVKTDAAIASRLEEERKRQTEASLEREKRNRIWGRCASHRRPRSRGR